MKHFTLLILIVTVIFSCKTTPQKENKILSKVQVKTTDNYELHQVKNSNKILVLFPGGGATSKETKEEFNILPIATDNNVSVLLMNFNRHLWIDKIQTAQLSKELETIFIENNLNQNDVFVGGMSIGGNVALTLANFQAESKKSIVPKGVFIIDSPIDLYALYESSIKDVSNSDFDEERLAEPKFIISYFEDKFGKESLLDNIQQVSPFTIKTDRNSVPFLKDIKLRFYTEPDSLWWKENRQTDFESTNAYAIQQIANQLKNEKWNQFELIETENKGYRSNGERHPHSWSIVDVDELLNWMKK